MKLFSLLFLLVLVSCASRTERRIASEEVIEIGEPALAKSQLRLYPVENQEQRSHQFYLELRNEASKLVDIDPREIQVKFKGREVPFEIHRITKGKYQLEVTNDFSEVVQLKFFVQGKEIQNSLKPLARPSQKHSKLVILSKDGHELKLQLTLHDKRGRPLDVPEGPEINLEGMGELSPVNLVKRGVWEFSVVYPEQNQIFYLSVRANGTLFRRLLRFHHIEK